MEPVHTHPDQCFFWYDGCHCDSVADESAALRARCARLEGALSVAQSALSDAWTQGDVNVAHSAHAALLVVDAALAEARARGAVGDE